MRFSAVIGGTALAFCLACASALAQTSTSCPPNQYLNKLGSPPAACATIGPGNLPAQPASTLLGNSAVSTAVPTTVPLTAPLGFSGGNEVLNFAAPLTNQSGSLSLNFAAPLANQAGSLGLSLAAPLTNQAGSLGLNLNSPLLKEGTTTVLKAIGPPGGRLAPASQNPTGAQSNLGQVSTIFYTHYISDQVPVWDGTNLVYLSIPGTEVSDSLPASGTGVVNANDVFDVYGIDNAGVFSICHVTNGSGAGWTGDTGGSTTARGTGYSAVGFSSSFPLITNTNSITNCYNSSANLGPISAKTGTYLGSFTTNAAGSYLFNVSPPGASGGPASTNAATVGLWNMYNRRQLSVFAFDSGVSYSYNSSVVRAARNSLNNAVTIVIGVAGESDRIQLNFVSTIGTAAVAGSIGRNAASVSATSFSAGGSSYSSCMTATANIIFCNSPTTFLIGAGNGIGLFYRVENTDGSTVTFDGNSVDFLAATYTQ